MKKMDERRALVLYGTRTGSSRGIAEEIGRTLEAEGYSINVVDAKKGVGSIDGYGLVVVGSGIRAGRWTGETDGFLRKNASKLRAKRLALFCSCGKAEDPEDHEEATNEYLVKKAEKHGLKPVSYGLFGGVYDFTKDRGILGNFMSRMVKLSLEERGIDTSKPYEFRDWDRIRLWARELTE